MICHIGLVVIAIVQCCLAFAPPNLLPSSTIFFVEDPTSSTRKDTTSVVSYYFDDLHSKGRRQVPRWKMYSRTPSVLGAGVKDNHYGHGKDDSNNSYNSEPILAANSVSVGGYSPEEKLGLQREAAIVGDPQVAQLESMNITMVLTELQAIQSQGPKKYCILGTRHCSFLHQQIVEMLYVFYPVIILVVDDEPNHVYFSCDGANTHGY